MLGKSHAAVGAAGMSITALAVTHPATLPAAAATATALAASIACAWAPLKILRAAGWLGFAISSSVAVGMALTALGAGHLVPTTHPVTLAVAVLVAAGWALAPDIDEPGSTVSRFLGPISRGASHIIRVLSGGHRELTHTWLFVALAVALGFLATLLPHGAGVGVIVFCATTLAWGTAIPGFLHKLAPLIGIAAGALSAHTAPEPIIFAMAYGTWLHILGDMATKSGVAVLAPWKKTLGWRVFSTTMLGRIPEKERTAAHYANAWAERVIVLLFVAIATVCLIATLDPAGVTVEWLPTL